MTLLRAMYVRYFRGTAVGNAMRHLWYWNERNVLQTLNVGQNLSAVAGTQSSSLPLFVSLRSALEKVRLFHHRTFYVLRYYWPRIRKAFSWLLESRESANFTYDLTPRNELHLAQFIAFALQRSPDEIAGYINEIKHDQSLKDAVTGQVKLLGQQGGYDLTARFGRRVGWYAIVRAMKPKIVIETGIEKGLGAAVLCAALLRNSQEGHRGRYFGTDIDRAAGMLLSEPYRAMGEILYGDSIESLSVLEVKVDVFINDSDHSADYEGREYRVIAPKLSECAVIIGDNSHVNDELLKFSRDTDRHFLFFREEPADHWYLGAGIGLSFKPSVESTDDAARYAR